MRETAILFDRRWAMPNSSTFFIKPISDVIKQHVSGHWIDPFCGINSPASCTNDLNPNIPATSHSDALVFLKNLSSDVADGGFYDPPYSMRQATECYKSYGKDKLKISVTSMLYWSSCKDELSRIIKPGGKAICCGWNSMGLGRKRGFEMIEILLVPHGGSRNDTIVTVEKKSCETSELL
jgi:hypothetical protein